MNRGDLAASRTRRARRAALVLAALACLLPCAAPGADRDLEYSVKAVFLERFARFVEWPAGALGEPGGPFRIVVLGQDPFDGLLEKAYASRPIRERRVEIRRVSSVEEIGPCHLLFLSSSVAAKLPAVLARLRGKPVLLVGDTDGYAQAGVHLNLFLEQGKVRFELNQEALKEAGLVASYLLQQVAVSVETRGGTR